MQLLRSSWACTFALTSLLACGHNGASDNGAVAADPASLGESAKEISVTTRQVDYQAGATTMKGFIAYPATEEKRPAVLVVHEWWGLNDYARARAKQLAEMGYVAMAIDMYGEGKSTTHPDDAKKFMQEVMADTTQAVARFRAAEEVLKSDPRVDATKLAAIGYCFGGGVVLAMARQGEPLAVVGSFHGMLATETPMKPGAFSGQVLVATGAADPFVPPEQVQAFEKEMQAAGAHYELDAYEGALHGFTNPEATAAGKASNMPLAYDEAADKASWEKLSAKLQESFGS